MKHRRGFGVAIRDQGIRCLYRNRRKKFRRGLLRTMKENSTNEVLGQRRVSISIGVQGCSIARPRKTMRLPMNLLEQHPETHVSNQSFVNSLEATNTLNVLRNWYAELPNKVRTFVDDTFFKDLLQCCPMEPCDTALLQVLAEHWWDSTHTFHIPKIGELTMTPLDFSVISGLHFGGIPVIFRGDLNVDNGTLIELIGYPATYITCKTVTIDWLYHTYRSFNVNNDDDEVHLKRAFLLALIGGSIFSNEDHTVNTHLLHSLRDLNKFNDYNWGGAALSYLYANMDHLSRGKVNTVSGLWIAWEVWANKYLPTINLNCRKNRSTCHRILSNSSFARPQAIDDTTALVYYRFCFTRLQLDEVCFSPWEVVEPLPEHVNNAISFTGKRILLVGPNGGNWYLGERVYAQRWSQPVWLIPRQPPRSMAERTRVSKVDIRWVISGHNASNFMLKGSSHKYQNFVAHVLCKRISNEEKHVKQPTPSPELRLNDQFIPPPPTTLVLPSTDGRPQVIHIPMDLKVPNLDIPAHVKQVSVGTVITLLRTIAGMQFVLVDQVLSARDSLREYEATIQNLTFQLNNFGKHDDDHYKSVQNT